MKIFASGIKNRLLFVVLTFVLLASLVFLFQAGILSKFEYKLKDSFFQERSSPTQVSIVHVDPASEEKYGQLLWNGKLLAAVVNQLDDAGVRVIGLDLPLSWEGDYEEELEKAIRSTDAPIVLSSEIDSSGIQMPQELFTQYSGVVSGYNNLDEAQDGKIRTTKFQETISDQKQYSFALRILQMYYELDDAEIFEFPINLGSSVINDNEHTINYYGPSNSINNISLSTLLEGHNLESLQNDVVVVAVSKPDDALLTPLGFIDENEVQATIVANEINNHAIVSMDSETLLTTLGILWLVFVILHLVFSFRIATLLVFLFAGSYGWVAMNSYSSGYSIEIIHVLSLVLGMWFINFVGWLFRLASRTNPITSEFIGVVNPKLLDKEFKNLGDGIVGERKEVTMMSGELLDLANLSKDVNPSEFVEFLNLFHGRSLSKIHNHRGAIIHNKSGELAALWNAPLNDPHQAINAALASLEIKDMLGDFNLQNSRSTIPNLKTGIGISSGDAIIGSLGTEDKFDYGIVGGPLEISRRLSRLAPKYGAGVLVDRSVVQNLADKGDKPQFQIRWVDRIRFKGWNESIDVFQLLTHTDIGNDTVDMIKAYEEALSEYLQGDFEAALKSFIKISEKYNDPASAVMTTRNKTLVSIQINWQGFWLVD